MAVNHDAVTESVRTLTTNPWTFTHTGRLDVNGGIQGVLVACIHGTSSTDHVSAVSYGGVALSRVNRATDTATEPGAAEWWFRGNGFSGLGGLQTVSVTCGSTTDDFHFVVITLIAGGDIIIMDSDSLSENAANPSVTLQYGGRTCISYAAMYGGGADPGSFTPNANCSTIHDHDLGAFYSEVIKQTTSGTSDFAIGGTSSSDDLAFVAVAVTEKINHTLAIDAMAVGISMQDIGFVRGYPLVVDAMVVGISMQDIGTLYNRALTVDAMAVPISMQDVGFLYNRLLGIDTMAVPISMQDVGFAHGYTLTVDPMSVPISMQDVGLLYKRILGVDAGVVPISMSDVGFLHGHLLAVDAMVVPINMSDIDFVFAGSGNYTLVIDQMDVPISMQDIGTFYNRALAIDTMAVPISMQDITLLFKRVLGIDAGSVPIALADVNFLYNRLLGVEAGVVPISMQDIAALYNRLLAIDTGAVPISMQDIGFIKSGAINYVLVIDSMAIPITMHDVGILLSMKELAVRIAAGDSIANVQGRPVMRVGRTESGATVSNDQANVKVTN